MNPQIMLSIISHILMKYGRLHRHQGPKGVHQVHPGGLGEHLRGHMGHQWIHCSARMQNYLFT